MSLYSSASSAALKPDQPSSASTNRQTKVQERQISKSEKEIMTSEGKVNNIFVLLRILGHTKTVNLLVPPTGKPRSGKPRGYS